MSNIEDSLSKAELDLIDKIIVAAGLAKFRNVLWQKVRQAFGFSFHGTNLEYGFARATPDERSLAYLEDRIFILSDKTQAKLVGDLRWELLEGIKNAESVDEIKRRLDKIFKGNTVNTERIARTEVLNAQNAGRQSAYEESEVTHYKMWRAAMKNPRTAADSKRLHGQIQEIENPFVDPKTGDSFMHPPNRPNCRCLYENPLVYTINGWKPINKIIVGELVLTHKGRFRKVTEIHKQSKKEIRYKVTTEYDSADYCRKPLNILTLTVTPDHPFLTQRGWIETSELKDTDKISTFAGRCRNCNSLYPLVPDGIGEKYYYNYCSYECARSYTAVEQWDDPDIMKDVPAKISANMKEQYVSGERSKERSPEHLAALIAAGTKALRDPKTIAKNWVFLSKEETEDIRNKIREGTAKWREENPEKWEEAKKNMSDARKQLHKDHPEKHVNRILAQKGYETNLEKSMREELDDRNIGYEKQYKIDRFFVDFAIPELKIAVECDGDYWHQDEEKEKIRDDIIISNGWDILHFKEGDILSDISKCVDSVERLMNNHEGNYEFMWLPILSIKICDPPQRARMTWNLSVEEDESFITKSMIVHNCTTIPMRKLPENIVHKGGQMYAADEMVGKIEIAIGSLSKEEKRIWVKPTSKRKGHYRKVKEVKKEWKINLRDGINNVNIIAKKDSDIKNLLESGEWDNKNSRFFSRISGCRDAIVHAEFSKIYAMSKLQSTGRSIHIALLEVNPNKQRRGYGIKAMKDIINVIIDSEDFDKIELTSLNANSDNFYNAIGMVRVNPEEEYQAEYEGGKQWMKKFMKSISKKQ